MAQQVQDRRQHGKHDERKRCAVRCDCAPASPPARRRSWRWRRGGPRGRAPSAWPAGSRSRLRRWQWRGKRKRGAVNLDAPQGGEGWRVALAHCNARSRPSSNRNDEVGPCRARSPDTSTPVSTQVSTRFSMVVGQLTRPSTPALGHSYNAAQQRNRGSVIRSAQHTSTGQCSAAAHRNTAIATTPSLAQVTLNAHSPVQGR